MLGEPVAAISEAVGALDEIEGRTHRLRAGLSPANGDEVENGEGGHSVVHLGWNAMAASAIPSFAPPSSGFSQQEGVTKAPPVASHL